MPADRSRPQTTSASDSPDTTFTTTVSPVCMPGRLLAEALAAGAEAVDALGTDPDDHALLARAEVRILVLAQVLLREHVDVLDRAVVDERGRAAHHHVPALLVRSREDGDGRPRIALDVLHLRPPVRAVDEDVLAVVVDPDRRRMRRAVLADG